MVSVRPSTDFGSIYNDISQFCKENNEPIFITNNGCDELAIMSIELYRQLTAQDELFSLIGEGLDAARVGHVRPYKEAMADIRTKVASA